jgi:hypothetical protein
MNTGYLVGAAGFEPATAGLEIRCSIRLSYAPSLVFSSVYQLRPPRKPYKGCTCLKGFGQLAHRILNFYVAYLDVALLGRAYITVTQYPLNHQIIDAQFLEIGRKSPPIGVPAVPFQSRLLQSWLDDSVGESAQVHWAPERVGEHHEEPWWTRSSIFRKGAMIGTSAGRISHPLSKFLHLSLTILLHTDRRIWR